MVHLIDGRDVPDGQGQIAYAQAVVKERFAEANVLFVLDQLIKGAIAGDHRADRRHCRLHADPGPATAWSVSSMR